MTPTDRQAVGRRIRAIRRQKDITQAELARRLGITSQSRVSDIERGRCAQNIDTLSAVAAALGVEIRDFFPPTRRPR